MLPETKKKVCDTKNICQVAPAELEDVLRGLAGVKDVAVIGVEDERSGQVPRAYVVVEDGVTEDKVILTTLTIGRIPSCPPSPPFSPILPYSPSRSTGS